MTFLHRTGSWRRLFRACLVALLLITSARLGFAQTRASIPSTEQQKESAKLLEEIHKLSRLKTAPEKQDVVKKLMVSSRDKSLASDQRYGVLTAVIPLAKEIGDFDSWLEAVNTLVGAFEVDANKEKTRLLTEFLEARKPGALLKPAAVEEALAIARVAARENRYADANSVLSASEGAVQRAKGANMLNKLVAETREAIVARQKDWNAFQAASTKLGTNADDPAANFTVGRWHLLQQADWKSALPFLAKVSDAKWKAAAELEQTAPLDALAQAAVGDAWWDIAQGLSEKGEGEAPAEPRTAARIVSQNEVRATKTALLIHAGEWYARAQPNLTSALKKQLVTKRLDEIAPLKGAAPVKPAAATSPVKVVGKHASPFQQRISRTPENLIAAGGTLETERSVEAAMNWLARHQNVDGSWGCKEYVRQCKDPSCAVHIGKDPQDYPMAATAFGMLPFLAAGKTHESSGPYQKVMRKGLIWMTRNQNQKTGQLGSGNMYEHGLATIALCEAYGVSKDQKLKNAAMAAVQFIEFAQNETSGGWHYTARPRTLGDTSVFGWQFMGLKSAQMAGLPVNKTTLNNTKKFLASVSKGKSGGLFAYMPQSQPSPSMSAVGLLSHQYSGLKRTDPAMTEGMNYLMANLKAAESDSYFLYYATQVIHNLPGKEWETWNRQTQTMLVNSQIKEGCASGSWKPIGSTHIAGPVMSTSIHALTLEIYYRYLPLYPENMGEAKAE